mgnify:FL=1
MKHVNFFSRKKELLSLSNFWLSDIKVKYMNSYITYPSGEHCFHGEKFRILGTLDNDPKLIAYSKQFRSPTDLTPSQAKVKGGKNGLKLNQNQLLFLDKTLAMMIQTNICNYKFNNYQQVRNDLLNSNDKILIHSARTLGPWNGRAKYENNELTVLGENKLGEIWMNLRK